MAKKSTTAVRKTAKKSTAKKGSPPKKGDMHTFDILLGGRVSKAVKLPIAGIKTLKNGARQAYAKNTYKKSIGGGDKVFRFIKKA